MFSVILVEDEIHILNYMKKKLAASGVFQVKEAFSDPEKALEGFGEIMPEVAFLDIEMPRMNGIELAKRLIAKKPDLRIIFTTAFEQYALDAFGVEAVDYLMKPVGDEDIARVIKRLKKTSLANIEPKADLWGHKINSVNCFGRFEVWDKDNRLVNWPTRKSEELFAYFLVNQGRYISKWELLELFWPEVETERGLNNLYNTVYRVKQVLKKLPSTTQVQKINEGYILLGDEFLSDIGSFTGFVSKYENNPQMPVDRAEEIYFTYAAPLFGLQDYAWSISLQKYFAVYFKKLCRKLLQGYWEQKLFEKADKAIRHYLTQHIEDEELVLEWLELLKNWEGREKAEEDFKKWLNEKLREADLPVLGELIPESDY
ncbi:MAG: response regulator containing CheY-like receiver and domain [Eubacterium sp.]|jgi:two-component SAPR family response regulator|nr:response regulator containing CheY-like receiver and domain [Eubacterium sp.]